VNGAEVPVLIGDSNTRLLYLWALENPYDLASCRLSTIGVIRYTSRPTRSTAKCELHNDLLVSSEGNTIHLWDISKIVASDCTYEAAKKNQRACYVKTLQGHDSTVTNLIELPGDEYNAPTILLSGDDGSIFKVWDVSSGQCIRHVDNSKLHLQPENLTTILLQDNTLASLYYLGFVRWSIKDGVIAKHRVWSSLAYSAIAEVSPGIVMCAETKGRIEFTDYRRANR